MSNNLFAQSKPADNKPSIFGNTTPALGGNIFGGNTATTPNTAGITGLFGPKTNQPPAQTAQQGGINMFATNNQQPAQQGGVLFGAQQQPATNTPSGGNIFGGATSKPAETNPLFAGNKPAQNNLLSGGGLIPTQPGVQAQTNPFGKNPQQPTTTTQPGGLFGVNTAQQQPVAQNKPTIFAQGTQPQPQTGANQPVIQGSGQQGITTPNLFGGQPKLEQAKKDNLFGGNVPASTGTTNPPATNTGTGGIFGGGTTGGTFNNANNAANTPTPEATTNVQPAKNDTTSTATAGTTGVNLFGANKPAFNITTSSTQSPNLFNNPNAQTATTTTPAQNPTTGGIFANQPQNPPQTTTTQPLASNPMTQAVVQKSTIQKQFDNQASKTVKQFMTSTRQQMELNYTELHKNSNNLLKYQQDSDENIKIYRNFEEMKPDFINNVDLNQRILTNLEQQQSEIQSHLDLIYQAIKPQRTDHPLVQALQDSIQLSQQVMMLQAESESQGGQGISHPSHEQLLLLYSTLDKLQTDIDRMNELVSITFPQSKNNQNYPYDGNRNNGFMYGYNQF